jgi:uncharacterized membrane protein YqhA
MFRRIERGFEWMLWNSRFLVVIAVIASLLVALAMFYVTAVDVFALLKDLIGYASLDQGAMHGDARAQVVARIAQIVDGFLFAVILLIFSFGLYELFISKIDAAENSEFAERILLVTSLDDLKERLSKVVFLILIVRYFEFALQQHLETPLEVLELAVGIALIGVALFLTNRRK